ncbi:tyrosine--tRNA ligase [Candidatus Falkowbacteria bacterium]|jgi:tyrosyl-tRNA synthetase|nr:tyrosine--tRNA ligase [Candidatus Falkowbacteria bacterium]MBT4433257.1 tyrosine--tRNA ligase [Candidatus Falkowbacteria bacterium]
MTKEQKIQELLTRGTVDLIVKKDLEEKLKSGKKLRIKYGVDPTGPKIHLGRASTMRKLAKFQELGHQIVLIVGDFTAQIGDASDKTNERPMLTYDDIKKNMENYLPQIGQVIDIKKAEVHYNSEWLGKLDYFDICRQADNFSVAQILDRENFSKRYKEGTRISLRELFYPLMQGYDSVAIKADIEIGGSDQLFNMLAGRTLQKAYNQKPQDVITYELMDGTDGRKMSTSWGNVILIEDEPNDIYGKIMSMRDEGVLKYFELATDMEMQEIQKIKKDLKANKLNPRDLKMRLAREIITMYHSEKDALNAEENFKKVFQDKGVPKDIKEEKIDKKWLKLKLKNDKKELVEREEYSVNILDLLVKTKLCSSKSEARRVVEQGGVKFNKKIIKNVTENVSVDKGWKILQKGKRHFVKIKL